MASICLDLNVLTAWRATHNTTSKAVLQYRICNRGYLLENHHKIISCPISFAHNLYIDGLVQEKRNSSALATELCLSCTNPYRWVSARKRNSSALAMELCLSCTNPSIYQLSYHFEILSQAYFPEMYVMGESWSMLYVHFSSYCLGLLLYLIHFDVQSIFRNVSNFQLWYNLPSNL